MTSTDAAPVFTREDLGVTMFWRDAPPDRQDRQRAWQDALRARGGTTLGEDVFVSELAAVYAAIRGATTATPGGHSRRADVTPMVVRTPYALAS